MKQIWKPFTFVETLPLSENWNKTFFSTNFFALLSPHFVKMSYSLKHYNFIGKIIIPKEYLIFEIYLCSIGRGARRLFHPINFREKEKEILDLIIGSDRYDSRIRPAGSLNDTSKIYIIFFTVLQCLLQFTVQKKIHIFFRIRFNWLYHIKAVQILIRKILVLDAPAMITLNLYVRSISRIDDVKMVRMH